MTVFWVVAACLIGAALLFVVPPLFLRKESAAEVERRAVNISIYKNQLEELDIDLAADDVNQEQYEKSRAEIERRLLEDVAAAEQDTGKTGKSLSLTTAGVVVLLVPLVAVLMYDELGNPDAMNPQMLVQPETSPHGDETNMAQQIEMMVSKLSQRLQENPQDIEGWVMLGRSMSVLGRYNEAVMAYENAIQFAGEDANVLADYADALAMAGGESLEGKPMEMLQRALAVDPNNQKALWLAGTGLFERGDFTGSIEYWGRLMNMLPPDSEDYEAMRANIAEAESYRQRQLAGEFGQAPIPQAMPEAASEQTAMAGPARVAGHVRITADLKSKTSPDDTLFVFARAVNGPPMPLAILRGQVSELPLEFSLDESMAMMPSMSIANFSQVVVGARISSSGNAMPQSGDLQGASGAVAVGSEGLEIVIDSIVP